MWIRFTLISLILLLFWSCEEVVELDIEFKEKIVVVSEIAPSRAATVSLSRTRPILSQPATDFVQADEISIIDRRSERESELFLQDPVKDDTINPNAADFPFYFSAEPDFILSNNTYELNIQVAGEELISATTKIPQRVEIQSLNLLNYTRNSDPRQDEVYDINFGLSFNHTDRDEKNYHLVFYFIYIVPQETESDTILYYYSLIPTVENLTMSMPYTTDFENGVLIREFDCESGRQQIEGNLSVSYEEEMSPFPPQLWVELRTTNADYHNYHFNLSRQLSQRDSILSQAILVPSNIKNGEGVFGGYNFDQGAIQLTN